MTSRIFIVVCCLLFSLQQVFAQDASLVLTDSSTTSPSTNNFANEQAVAPFVFKPNPKRAVLYATFIPGLGQMYNRKYWKVPFVYAGYAALIYAISWNGLYYAQYKKAYISIADTNPNTNDYLQYIPVGYDENTFDMAWLSQVIQQKYLGYRYNRDLAIIGIVAFYGITILDAFVDAQLYDFDISQDLSMRLEPYMNNSFNIKETTVGLRCQFTF